ncbi:MAG: hypothetical protein RLZ07_1879 [Pseudomonadota bacterium]
MLDGADSGTRTRTAFQPRDFKSLASTSFAMSAIKKNRRIKESQLTGKIPRPL